MTTVVINGEQVQVSAALAVSELMAERVPQGPDGVAVAVNDAVVPRGSWSVTTLAEGDRVEIISAVQGG